MTTLPIIMVGVFSYLKSSDVIQSNIAKEKQHSVYQIQTNFEHVLKTLDIPVTNLTTSYQLIKTLEEPLTEFQFQLYNQTKSELVQLQRIDAGVEDLLLVSFDQKWRINNNGLRRLKDDQYEDLMNKYLSLPNNSTWKLEMKNEVLFDSNASSMCSAYISLVKQLPLNSSHKTGLSIAYLPICNFTDILTTNEESEEFMVLDEDFQVIGHSDFSNIGRDFSQETFTSKLSSLDVDVGQFDITKDGQDYKVTYRKSTYNNWTYISIIKLSELNKETISIGWFTFIMSAIILVGILFFAFITSRRLYKPINSLFLTLSNSLTHISGNGDNNKNDEFSIIENKIQHIIEQNDQLELNLKGQITQLKQFFIAKLLQGKISVEELPNKLDSFNYNQIWNRFSVLTIQIDSLSDTRYHKNDEDLLLFTINTMIQELIPSTNCMTPIVVNKTQVTIYLDNHENKLEYYDNITRVIKEIQLKIKEELNLSISVGLSEPSTDLIHADRAFKESLEALRSTLKFGPGSIIFFEKLEKNLSFYTFYPRKIENELFDAIKISDKEDVDKNLDMLLKSLFDKKLTQTQYEIAIVRFLTNLLELTETLGVDVLAFENHKSLFDQLYGFKTLSEVEDWFREAIIYPVMHKVEERTESQYKNISDEIIHIVQQEYDSDLTLNYIADKLHYNPNYLSSIFRKETNTSFSDYLALFRLKKAKKWLVESDMTVKEIAEKLNYNNSQNFIRSFRKIEGTTPGQYRKDKKN